MTGDRLAATLSRMDATQAKDKVGKRMFRHRRLVADMLVHYVPGRWVRRIDVGTLRTMPTEYVNRSGDRRFGDALWLSQLHDGRQVMPIVELQSSGDPNMAARMAAYAGMVYESLTADAKGPDGRYPGLLPLVVYTGGDAWRAADSLRALVDRIDGLAHHVAARCYRRIDLLQAGGARCAADEPAGLPGAADGQRVALAHGGDPQGCGDVVSGRRRRRGGPEPVPVVPSAVFRKFLVFQSSPCASMQGVVRREYRAYWQGPQRGGGAHGELPKGAPHGALGRVAPLGNGSTIPGGDAPCHRPRGTR